MPAPVPLHHKVVLFQIVDRRNNPLPGATVEILEGGSRVARLKTGTRAGRYEPSSAAPITFVAWYDRHGPHEGSPDVNGMCRIQFPEVDMSPPPDNSKIFRLITAMAGVFALVAIFGGVSLVYLGAAGGETEMNILGSTVKTANAGVAAIALGGLILLFTARRILKTIETLNRR